MSLPVSLPVGDTGCVGTSAHERQAYPPSASLERVTVLGMPSGGRCSRRGRCPNLARRRMPASNVAPLPYRGEVKRLERVAPWNRGEPGGRRPRRGGRRPCTGDLRAPARPARPARPASGRRGHRGVPPCGPAMPTTAGRRSRAYPGRAPHPPPRPSWFQRRIVAHAAMPQRAFRQPLLPGGGLQVVLVGLASGILVQSRLLRPSVTKAERLRETLWMVVARAGPPACIAMAQAGGLQPEIYDKTSTSPMPVGRRKC
jgi:hypothetical protein